MTGLSDGRKSFKVGLVVLIQYRLRQTATQPATQPDSHVAVAIRLYAIASSPKMEEVIELLFSDNVEFAESLPYQPKGHAAVSVC